MAAVSVIDGLWAVAARAIGYDSKRPSSRPFAMRRPDETPLPAVQVAEPQSKTRRKEAMTALQALGEALLRLGPVRRAELALPERLTEALDAAQRITQREARRRQLQFIGRLMREVDAAPIRARLAQWADAPNAEKARLHALERWRERLLTEPGALDVLCAERPGADRARLAGLIESVRAERAHAQPPRAYRELFRALDALVRAANEGPAPGPNPGPLPGASA
jgi:ribosome-associated protein